MVRLLLVAFLAFVLINAPPAAATGSGTKVVTGTVADGAGVVYEVGQYRGTVDFDPDPVATAFRTSTTSEGNAELFLASYTDLGAFRFVHVFPAVGGGPFNNWGASVSDILADASGVVMTGDFFGRVDFDPDPGAMVSFENTPDGDDAFVASFATDGDLRFARDVGGDPYGRGLDLALSSTGDVFATGYYESSTFDYVPGIYLESYTSSGDVRFAYYFAEIYPDFEADYPGPFYVPSGGQGTDVSIDESGDIVLRGQCFGILDFDPDPVETNWVECDGPFVVRFTFGGVFLSAVIGESTPPVCGPLAFDMSGNGSVYSTVSDPETGIASVEFTHLNNLDGLVDGVGPFAVGDTYVVPGTPTSVELRGTRIDPAERRAGLLAIVTNGMGMTSVCDPVVAELDASADATALLAPAPNPMRGAARIPFTLAESSLVRLVVYDVMGREVARLVDGPMAQGAYAVTWDATDAVSRSLSSGVYVVRLEAGRVVQTQTITVVR